MSEMKQGVLMQPNRLIKSEYDFTSIENKLFYKILYNAQKHHTSDSLYKTVLTVDEIRTFMKKKADYTVESIEAKLDMFKTNILSFDYIEEGTGKVMTFNAGLITSHHFDHEEQLFIIEIHELIHKHITDFVKMQKEGYAPINLDLLFNFKGAYTQRLYTLIRLWTRQNKKVDIKFTVKTLRSYLKAMNKFTTYANFKNKVILPAIREINKSGNMTITFENKVDEIKKGRSIHEIVLHVVDHETRKYFDNDAEAVKPVLVEVPEEESFEVHNQEKKDLFRRFLLENTRFTEPVLDCFLFEYGSLAEQFMEVDSPYLRMLLELQSKILEKDGVREIGARQISYVNKSLMGLIVQYDIENSLTQKANDEVFDEAEFYGEEW